MSDRKTKVVTMKDGREVDFGVRGKLKKLVEITGEGAERIAKVFIDCTNGESHSMEISAEHPLFFELAAHGASQKITDSTTKAEDEDDISFAVQNQIKQLLEGVWSQRSSDSLVRGFSDLFEALRRIKHETEGGYEVNSEKTATLKRNLSERSEDDIKLLKTNSNIKAILAQIVSEKAIAKAEKLASASDRDSGASLKDLGL